jgi:YggT family protein
VDIVIELLRLALFLYILVLFSRVVLDLVRMLARDWRPTGVVLVLAEGVYMLTDPPLRALRKVIPPLSLGPVRLDLAFMVLLLACYLLSGLLSTLA